MNFEYDNNNICASWMNFWFGEILLDLLYVTGAIRNRNTFNKWFEWYGLFISSMNRLILKYQYCYDLCQWKTKTKSHEKFDLDTMGLQFRVSVWWLKVRVTVKAMNYIVLDQTLNVRWGYRYLKGSGIHLFFGLAILDTSFALGIGFTLSV